MKVSLNWARKFTDISLATNELVKLATERLGGVEGYEELGKHYEGIVVARVVSCVKHSNADKLNVCKVDDGGVVKDVARDEDGYVQVVCGAANVREGILVAWIPPSAVVPSSYGEKELFVLEARDLRGELSNGMLASPRELGLSEDHEGILEIDPNTLVSLVRHSERSDNEVEESRSFDDAQDDKTVEAGTLFRDLYDLDDTIIEIENKMFTHRPDCFGQLGVARELSGIQHKPFTSPDWYLSPQLPEAGNPNISITIEDPKMCPRYMAVEITDIEVKPSPVWLQSYLNRAGMRPINNVVDITNYIMLETAQPLHAFDFDKIARSGRHSERSNNEVEESRSFDDAQDGRTVHIIVRKPTDGEELLLLDGKKITPHKDATLICNEDGPIALGGVKGGGNSEVDKNTTRILLECATFNMYNIRKTSMVHGIFSDAVARLNKGQPAEQLPSILGRAISMFEEIANAKVIGYEDSYPTKSANERDYIEVSAKFINDRLGSKFTDEQIVTLLTNVEFKAHVASGPISVTPPFWRTDIELPEDIVEEIGRLYGFDQLPITLPKRSIEPVASNAMLSLKTELRQALSRAGANEVLTYSFVHDDLLKKAEQDPAQAFALRNALSPDLQYYRLSLLPSLLDKIRPNIKAGYDEFTLFEIGKGHNKAVIDEKTKLPDEINNLEMVYTSAKSKPGAAYFRMLKTADSLLANLGISYALKPAEESPFHQALTPFNHERSAYIMNAANGGGMIGFVGELKESVIKAFKLPEYTAAAVFALDGPSFYANNRTSGGVYKPLSKYQTSKQDLTLKVNQDTQFAQLKVLLEDQLAKTEYDTVLTPLGVYQKDSEETKNISFRITFSHSDHTLTTDEVTKVVESLSWTAHEQLNAEQV